MHQAKRNVQVVAKYLLITTVVAIPLLLLGDRIVAGLFLSILGTALLCFAVMRFQADPTVAAILLLACGLFRSPYGFAKPIDIFFVLVIGASFFMRQHRKRMFGQDRTSRNFVYFMCALYALSSLFSALTRRGAPNDIYLDLRPGLYLLTLPLLLSIFSSDAQRWEKALRITVALFSAIALVQFVAGVGFIGTVGDLETLGDVTEGITRVTSPANYFVGLFLFLTLSRWLSYGKISVIDIGISVSGLATLAVSFGRGFWYTTILGVLIVLMLARGKGRLRSALLIVFAIAALAIVLEVFSSSAFLASLTDRFTSVGKEVDHGDSLGWRDMENFYALKSLGESAPLYFLGVGVPYKPVLIDMDLFATQQIYIHNTYLGLLMKLGGFGLIAFLWYLAVMARRIIALLSSKGYRHLATALLAGLVQFVAVAVTQPAFIDTSGVVYFCFLAAGISIAFHAHRAERLARNSAYIAPTSAGMPQ